MLQELTSDVLVHLIDEDGQYKMGLMALGKSVMQEWSSKGLAINDESAVAAGIAFQNAFKETVKQSGPSLAGTNLVLNKHQIIINSQEVPDWFKKEYESAVS